MEQLDTDIFLWLNNHTCQWLDNFMWLYTGKLEWVLLYVAILYSMYYRYGWRRTLGLVVLVALIITVCDQMCGHWVRNTIMRLRPSNPDNPISPMVHIVNGYRGGPYGFPSCHAANTFGLAVFVSLLFRQRAITIAMLLWAVVTAYSRVILGVHYPGDLLVGAMVGTVVAISAYYSAMAIYRKYPHSEVIVDDRPSAYIVSILVAIVIVMAVKSFF